MGDTYDTLAEAETDREQRSLLTALNAWDRALRRDECSAWCITGKHGRIYTWGDAKTWVLWVGCRSGLHWTHTKKRLDFCTVTQGGWDEGCLRLHHLPTPEQAEIIRDVLGIRKRVELAPETLEWLRARTAAWNGPEPLAKATRGAKDGGDQGPEENPNPNRSAEIQPQARHEAEAPKPRLKAETDA